VPSYNIYIIYIVAERRMIERRMIERRMIERRVIEFEFAEK
jgi:hypothetical protein